jgi:hypothetical protein
MKHYDEALRSAVDAIETVPVSASNVRDNLMDASSDDTDDLLCCVAIDTVEGGWQKMNIK